MRIPRSLSFVLMFALLAGCGTPQKTLRQVPREKRSGLMVLNFKNATLKSRAEEYGPWEFGIPSMLMTDLEAIGLFTIISREQMKEVIQEQEFQMSGMVDPDKAVKLGRILAARYMLAGSFMEMNGSLRIESRVYSVETGAQLGAAAVAGKTDGFFELQKELVVKVSSYLDTMLSAEEAKLIAKNVETRSVDASLNNYRGEIAVMKAEELKAKGAADEAKKALETAKTSFQKAIALDPEYEKARKNLARISLAVPVTL
jgi:TolB-like protein